MIDLFRDRLENAESELAECKNRNSDLEGQLTDTNAKILASSELVSETGAHLPYFYFQLLMYQTHKGAHLSRTNSELRHYQEESMNTLREYVTCETKLKFSEAESVLCTTSRA